MEYPDATLTYDKACCPSCGCELTNIRPDAASEAPEQVSTRIGDCPNDACQQQCVCVARGPATPQQAIF